MDRTINNFDEIFKVWAWKNFEKQGKTTLTYENAQIDVIWDRVHIVTENHKFSKQKFTPNIKTQILFSSTFDNETNHLQCHNFQTSRTTTARASIKLTKGFTRGLNAGIKLPVPDEILKVTSAFGTSLTFDSEEENVIEKSLTWAVNTTVTAPKRQKTLAVLEIIDHQFECCFEMHMTMRGTVIVRITDPVSRQVAMVVQNKIATIWIDLNRNEQLKNKQITFNFKGDAIFQYGVFQRVRVYQEDLDKDEDEEEEEDESTSEESDGDGEGAQEEKSSDDDGEEEEEDESTSEESDGDGKDADEEESSDAEEDEEEEEDDSESEESDEHDNITVVISVKRGK